MRIYRISYCGDISVLLADNLTQAASYIADTYELQNYELVIDFDNSLHTKTLFNGSCDGLEYHFEIDELEIDQLPCWI